MSNKRMYIAYDGRAAHDAGTEDAAVLEVLGDFKSDHAAVRECVKSGWPEAAIYSYLATGDKLTDQQYVDYFCDDGEADED
jgi:hypothetical protein